MIAKAIKGCLAVIGLVLLASWLVQATWNSVVVSAIDGTRPIEFSQAFVVTMIGTAFVFVFLAAIQAMVKNAVKAALAAREMPLTINEHRKLKDLPPVAGGDKLLVVHTRWGKDTRGD